MYILTFTLHDEIHSETFTTSFENDALPLFQRWLTAWKAHVRLCTRVDPDDFRSSWEYRDTCQRESDRQFCSFAEQEFLHFSPLSHRLWTATGQSFSLTTGVGA